MRGAKAGASPRDPQGRRHTPIRCNTQIFHNAQTAQGTAFAGVAFSVCLSATPSVSCCICGIPVLSHIVWPGQPARVAVAYLPMHTSRRPDHDRSRGPWTPMGIHFSIFNLYSDHFHPPVPWCFIWLFKLDTLTPNPMGAPWGFIWRHKAYAQTISKH